MSINNQFNQYRRPELLTLIDTRLDKLRRAIAKLNEIVPPEVNSTTVDQNANLPTENEGIAAVTDLADYRSDRESDTATAGSVLAEHHTPPNNEGLPTVTDIGERRRLAIKAAKNKVNASFGDHIPPAHSTTNEQEIIPGNRIPA